MYVKGVNLGNWLVLEKWMSPGLFAGTTAEDEYYLPAQLSPKVYEARIKTHRSEYITELDRAFAWAEKYGMKILIDLHTAPMSQNGFDNGGLSGVCRWAQLPEEVEFELNVLEKLAERYGKREGLLGITPINEPCTERTWEMLGVQRRYPPADPKLAEGSAPITMDFLKEFYKNAYARIRKHLDEDKYVVFHDGFELKAWKDFFAEQDFRNIVLDTHMYLMVAEPDGCEQTVEGYRKYIEEHFAKDIAEVQEYVDVICGEWCLFNSYAVGTDTKGGQTVLNGMDFSENKETMDAEAKKQIYLQIAEAQLDAWKRGSGYFYWSYKLLLDTVNEPNWIGWDCWDLGKSAAMGWFPMGG